MVAARWNLVRTECGPLVQKVVDPWSISSFTNCSESPDGLPYDHYYECKNKFEVFGLTRSGIEPYLQLQLPVL